MALHIALALEKLVKGNENYYFHLFPNEAGHPFISNKVITLRLLQSLVLREC